MIDLLEVKKDRLKTIRDQLKKDCMRDKNSPSKLPLWQVKLLKEEREQLKNQIKNIEACRNMKTCT